MKASPFFAVLLLAAAWASSVLPARAGSIIRLFYDGVNGVAVSDLTNAVIFPNEPTFREQLDDFSGGSVTGLDGRENVGSNFGTWIQGYLEAPESGDHRFYIASDDASELRLSTDHTEAGLRRIAYEPNAGAALFSETRIEERRSAPIPLTKGNKYLLQVLQKQGAGASFIRVGWQRPDGTQEIIPARHLAQHPLDPYVGRLDPNLPPTFNPDGQNGGDLPATFSAGEGEEAVLELDVIAAQPTTIRWRRNGSVIPGETLSFLRLSQVPQIANGDTIEAEISNAYGTLTSTTLRLALSADVTPPSVVSVDHRGNPNGLRVTFSERVAPAAATSLVHYELKSSSGTAIPIGSAILLPGDLAVELSGNFNFTLGGQYQLTVRDIEDQADIPNTLSPNPSSHSVTFTGEFIGPIGFAATNPLQDLSVVENRVAHFEVLLTGAKPWFYQWFRNDAPIPGATNAVLEMVAVLGSNDRFKVAVSNEFSAATSPTVQLTVLSDTTPPELVSVRGLGGGFSEVRLVFDEPLNPASATRVSNYSVDGIAVLSASLGADGRSVILKTDPLAVGRTYLLSLIGIEDTSGSGGSLSATASFVAQADYKGTVLADSPIRYWRFDETDGNSAATLASALDPISVGTGTLVNSPTLGVPSLVPGSSENTAVELKAENGQVITVPNGSDINSGGPWAKKSFEVWFKASSAPAPDSTGLAATAGIWEEGAAARNIALYLWRDPSKPNPDEAELVFHSFNDPADGPGAPYGLLGRPAVFVQTTIQVGQTYHAVAVQNGDATGVTGSLILYLNGVEVARTGDVGQIYAHTGDVQIGRGNGIIHTGENGNLGYFDGVLDDLSAYNIALSAERVAAHYQAGFGGGSSGGPLGILQADSRGEPNRLLVTFTTPVAPASVTPARFILRPTGGAALPVESATLLPGGLTVQLSGPFNFQASADYSVSVQDVTDTAGVAIVPNPASSTFTFPGAGAVGISAASELGNRAAIENEVVRFKVVPTGTGPFAYQWFHNGVALEGEKNPELAVIASASTVGTYTVTVSNAFSELTSAGATVSVGSDTTPPQVTEVLAIGGSINEIRIAFDEAVEIASATSTATYSLGSIAVLSAQLSEDGLQVTLSTGPLPVGEPQTLTIQGLKDRSVTGNALNTTVPFTAAFNYVAEILKDGPTRYWRFEESSGNTAVSETRGNDTAVNGTYQNEPELGVPALVPSQAQAGAHAVHLSAAASQRILVPNGADINIAPGAPWAKKSFSFWFQANSVPAPGTEGLASIAGLWEQGGDARGIQLYVWRNPDTTDPNQASLVFHAFNNASDGPGAPFGQGAGGIILYVEHPIQTGVTYHVVGVFDGDPAGTTGKLILYVNGEPVGEVGEVGQIYAHGSDVQIGRGNARHHNATSGDAQFFDGVIDEVAIFNTALSLERVRAQYQAGIGVPAGPTPPAVTGVDTRGNPNGLRVTFNQDVQPASATQVANYTVRVAGGAALTVTNAQLVPGTPSVQLSGVFNFAAGSTYEVMVRDVANLATPPEVLAPNPTTLTFIFPPGAGPVGISPESRLSSVTAGENEGVRFDVVATGTGPYQYQWFRNNAELAGRTNSVLEITATAETTGDYTVRVWNEFSEITSAPATLSFNLDATPAQVTEARAFAGHINEFRLRFSEPLDPVTAQNPATYSVGGLVVSEAVLSQDQQGVTLRAGALEAGREYTIQITGLKDQSSGGNPLLTTVTVSADVSYREEILAGGPVRYWRFNEAPGATQVATLVTARDALAGAAAALNGEPTLGVPGLVPNAGGDTAIRFNGSSSFLAVPNGEDLNITAGPWTAKSFAFWFQAESLPRGGASPEAPVIWEQGGDSRGLGIYLYGTQDTDNPTEALLVW
ncbi:MAG: Ig-like domain-containing protein, partial [Verrucomicrobiae bacterium]|nr:Ig-like domain-containing protein [Verrucomicrobiae bacterium]